VSRAASIQIAVALLLTGCTYTRVVNDPWGNLPMERRPQMQPGDLQPGQRGSRGLDPMLMQDLWTVLLLDGVDPRADRQTLLQTMRTVQGQSGVPPLWSYEHGGSISLYAGRFPDPLSDAAQEQLAAIRAVELDGGRPFARVKFVNFASRMGTTEETVSATFDEFDLKQYIGMYTLQIGFYDETAGEGFRDAAELAVKQLRADDEEAYYYHGPNRSLVCIGLFTEDDLSQHQGITVYSPRILKLQEKYPHNLANGRTLIERLGDREIEQRSFLVQVH